VLRNSIRRTSKSNNASLSVHLGFASIPLSLEEQIARTPSNSTAEWFEIESNWTHEIGAEVSLALTSYRNELQRKRRQIVLTVKTDNRLTPEQGLDLFTHISKAIEDSDVLAVKHWKGDVGVGEHKRHVWQNGNKSAGRKVVRPIVEAAVQGWLDAQG
jgi:exopolyphosphatase